LNKNLQAFLPGEELNKGLTSFRALAFFVVFLGHAGALNAGYLGVQAFFVLSGFLLTPILIDMKAKLDTRPYFVNFYGRRALRIFPLYYTYLLVVAGVALVIVNGSGYTGVPGLDRFLTQFPWVMTYTYNFFHASDFHEHTHLINHFWSLGVEEQFYLVWPFLLLLTPRRLLKKTLLAIVVAGPLVRLLIAWVISQNLVPVFLDHAELVIYVLPFSHFDAFAVGGFFALYQKSRSPEFAWVVLGSALLLGFVTDWLFSDYTGSIYGFISRLGYPLFMQDSYKYIWGYSVLNLVFAFLLIQIKDRKFIPSLFENGLLNYLGTISYGLYVFHYPVIWLVGLMLPDSSGIVKGILSLLVTIPVSALSYELMEKRFIGLKSRYFPKESK
jgi:peptidoglycan/LPS O-acetylase OafA/YrhL